MVRQTGLLVIFSLLVSGGSGVDGESVVLGQEFPKPGLSKIQIPLGNTVTVDGAFHSQEWRDADSLLLNTWSPEPVVVHFKHDGSSLLFAFSGFDEKRPLVPEVVLAVAEQEATVWSSAHWWFHASGTDCWASGSYNQWNTCVPEAPGWEASNPPRTGEWPASLVWEMRIPFSTLSLDPGSKTHLGISFDVTDTGRVWFFWPLGAQMGIPSTWAEAVLEGEIRGTR